jgi:cell shape-determining protein MreD
MSWAAFILAAAAALTLDASFMPVLQFGGVTPSLVGCLAAFVALHAERRAAWWGCLVLGLLVDFSSPVAVGGGVTFVPGPNAVGFTLGAAMVLSLRAEVMRRSMMAAAAATLVLMSLAAVAWTFVWALRSWWPDGQPVWTGSALSQLWHQMLVALVSAVLALPVSWTLGRTFDQWGFPASRRRRG